MKLVMSCYACGSKDFEHSPLCCHTIEGKSYLNHEEHKKNVVTCKRCGLQDLIDNLVITFE